MTNRFIKKILMGVGVTVAWFVICTMLLTVWLGHPAEAPVDGIAYMATIGGGF